MEFTGWTLTRKQALKGCLDERLRKGLKNWRRTYLICTVLEKGVDWGMRLASLKARGLPYYCKHLPVIGDGTLFWGLFLAFA